MLIRWKTKPFIISDVVKWFTDLLTNKMFSKHISYRNFKIDIYLKSIAWKLMILKGFFVKSQPVE